MAASFGATAVANSNSLTAMTHQQQQAALQQRWQPSCSAQAQHNLGTSGFGPPATATTTHWVSGTSNQHSQRPGVSSAAAAAYRGRSSSHGSPPNFTGHYQSALPQPYGQYAHTDDVWQRCEVSTVPAAQQPLQMLGASAPSTHRLPATNNSSSSSSDLDQQQPTLLLHVELQQLLQQQCMRAAAATLTSGTPSYSNTAVLPMGQVGQTASAGVQVSRRPAYKRKHAATLQDNTPSAAEAARGSKAAAGSAANTAARAQRLTATLGSTAVADTAGCFGFAAGVAAQQGHSQCVRHPSPPSAAGPGSVAALLGASSSDQAAAQLHGMSRQQLFSFAAAVLATNGGCQDPPTTAGCSSGATDSGCMPLPCKTAGVSSSGGSAGSLCATSDCHCKSPAAAAAAAPAAAGLQTGLLPAVQLLDSYYSKPMSPAEAAAEAAAMAGAIVAAAKAAAAEKVNSSSRSCSPCSSGGPRLSQGPSSPQGPQNAAMHMASRAVVKNPSSAGVPGHQQEAVGSFTGGAVFDTAAVAAAVAANPGASQHMQLHSMQQQQQLQPGMHPSPVAGSSSQLCAQEVTNGYVSLAEGYVSLGCTPDVTPHTAQGYDGCFGLLSPPTQPNSAVQGTGSDYGWTGEATVSALDFSDLL
jgi:hypothetical protein